MEQLLINFLPRMGEAAIAVILLYIFGRTLFNKFMKLIDQAQDEKKVLEKEFFEYLKSNSHEQLKIIDRNTESTAEFSQAIKALAMSIEKFAQSNQELVKTIEIQHKFYKRKLCEEKIKK